MIQPGFRSRLLAELTELIPPETEPSVPALPSAPPRHSGRRRLMLAAAAAAATAIVAALVLPVLDGPTGSAPAWAVERSEDGSVLVTVHEVNDPVRLQEDLRAAGVAAVVRAGSPSCATWLGESEPELGAVLREDVRRSGDDHFWRIDPRALRPGHFLALLITRVTATGTPGGNEPVVVSATSYSVTVTATDNPPCAPLPGPHSTSPVPATS